MPVETHVDEHACEFTKILLYHRPVQENHQWPIADPSETDMHNWRPPSLVGDQHAWSETQRKSTCLRRPTYRGQTYMQTIQNLNMTCQSLIGFRLRKSVSNGYPIVDVGLPIWNRTVHIFNTVLSNGVQFILPHRFYISDAVGWNVPVMHVNLWWVSEKTCRSPIRYVGLRLISDRSLIDLR